MRLHVATLLASLSRTPCARTEKELTACAEKLSVAARVASSVPGKSYESGTFWRLPAILPKCQLLLCMPLAAKVPEPFH